MWMKITRWVLCTVFVACFARQEAAAQAHTVGQTFSSLFFLDGKNVVEMKEFSLGLDDIIRFEAYEMLAGTVVTMKVSGAGLKTSEKIYTVNERGESKATLFFPEAKGKLTVVVKFTTKNGHPEQIRFFLTPAY
jgi:hypothetical protein